MDYISLLLILLFSTLICIVYLVTIYTKLKNENKRLLAMLRELEKNADKALRNAMNYQSQYVELLTKYEHLRDAVTKDDFLRQFDQNAKTIKELEEENGYLRKHIDDIEFRGRFNRFNL